MIKPLSFANPGYPFSSRAPTSGGGPPPNADFYVQTAGTGASAMIVNGSGVVTSIAAGSNSFFLAKSAVGPGPTLLNVPSLNNATALCFPTGQVLEMDNAVPAAYLNNSPRSFYFVMYIPASENRNIFGYGTQTNRGIYDLLMYGGPYIGLHWYGGSVYSQVPVPFGKWCLFRSHYDGAGYLTNQIDNDAPLTTNCGTLGTGSAQSFRLGQGTYPGYNSTGSGVNLAHFEAYAATMTAAQDLAICNRIRTVYGMPTY